jgi:hypothetical protein
MVIGCIPVKDEDSFLVVGGDAGSSNHFAVGVVQPLGGKVVDPLEQRDIIRQPDDCPQRVHYLTSSPPNAWHWILISSSQKRPRSSAL